MLKEKPYLVPCLVVGFIVVFAALSNMCEDKYKVRDKLLWEPWLALKADEIQSMEIKPIEDPGLTTISNHLIIEDRHLIYRLKECLSRKPMVAADKPGYHWFSQKRICLTADSNEEQFSFIALFHNDFPSAEYQMLSVGGRSIYKTIGKGWRSAELYNILDGIISRNKSIRWVDVE